MRSPLIVTKAKLTPASTADREIGLLAYVQVVLNDSIGVDGITLRRTLEGETILSWPEKRDRSGAVHRLVRPMDSRARAELEAQIFAKLGLDSRRAS
jgi:DNA-binding cell septation regulator SpoVG